MQLVHLKNIETKKESENQNFKNEENGKQQNLVGDSLKDENLEKKINQIKNQMKNIDQIKNRPIEDISNSDNETNNDIRSFQDLINKTTIEKEIELKYDLERNVKLVSFNKGKIDISFNENLNQNFIKNLTEKLLSWTGERWIISLSKNNNAKSMYEKNLEKKTSLLETFEKNEISKQIKNAFPDAKLIEIQEDSDND